MRQIARTRHVRAPKAEVWRWLSDYANIHRFHPDLRAVHQETRQACGVGAVRRCDLKDGHFLRERVTAWTEGEGYRAEIFESSMPFVRAFASLGVRDAPGGAEAYMIMEYTPRFGPLGWVMDRVMIRREIGGMMDRVLDALAEAVETVETVAAEPVVPRPTVLWPV